MIPLSVIFMSTEEPAGDGVRGVRNRRMDRRVYVDAGRIDSVTPLGPADFKDCGWTQEVQDRVRAVVRYHDVLTGYRYYWVSDDAKQVARARFRYLQNGEDPDSTDFGGDVPDHLPKDI